MLYQTTIIPAQIIKPGVELSKDNNNVLRDRKPGTFTISGTQTFSNFTSLQVCKLKPVQLLSN